MAHNHDEKSYDGSASVPDGGDGRELIRYWFHPHNISPYNWEAPDYYNLGIISKEDIATSDSGRYHSLSLSKNYQVNSAQDLTVRFAVDKPFSGVKLDVGDVAMQLIYFPDMATAFTPQVNGNDGKNPLTSPSLKGLVKKL